MSGKRGIPLFEVVIMAAVLIGLLIYASWQYTMARLKAEAHALGKIGIQATTHRTRFIHVYVHYTDFCDDDFDLIEHVGPFEDFNAEFSHVTPQGLRKLPYPETIEALNLTGLVVQDSDLDVLLRFPNLKKLDLTATFVTDAGLPVLARLTKLAELSLQQCDVTDSGMQHLSQLEELHTLNVAFTEVTAPGLSVIDGLPRLSKVVIWPRPKPTDAPLRFEIEVTRQLAEPHQPRSIRRPAGRSTRPLKLPWPDDFAERFPRLVRERSTTHSTNLNGQKFRDSDAIHLRNLRFLQGLHLNGTAIGDKTVCQLAQHHRYIYALSLASTNVTDAGLDALKHLPMLTYVNLQNTQITDAGLLKLRNVRQLDSLALSGTRVTQAGIVALRKEFPNIRIRGGARIR